MSRDSASKVKLASFDTLFGSESTEQQMEGIREIPLKDLHAFHNHPFKVLDDELMQETVDSIKKYGVLVPGIARPLDGGEYELIAGHRRSRGSELAGNTTMPVIVRDLSDDEAIIIMVDSNIQRENLLFSEKAFAYKMKLDAIKHQGSKGKNSADAVGEINGDSGRQVQRYIRLTELIPALLDLVDSKKLQFGAAVDISYLTKIEQEWVLKTVEETSVSPSGPQAAKIRKYSEGKELTYAMVKVILGQEKEEPVKLTLPKNRIAQYFPKEYTKQQIEETIYQLLEEWTKRN